MLAGEHSGDKIGAKLINQLKKYSNLEIVGVGGPAMEKAGFKSMLVVLTKMQQGIGTVMGSIKTLTVPLGCIRLSTLGFAMD